MLSKFIGIAYLLLLIISLFLSLYKKQKNRTLLFSSFFLLPIAGEISNRTIFTKKRPLSKQVKCKACNTIFSIHDPICPTCKQKGINIYITEQI